jgi:hypothetical protein
MYKLFEKNVHIQIIQPYQTRKTYKLWKKIPIQIIVLCFMCKKRLQQRKNFFLNQLFLKIRRPMCKDKVCIYGYKYTKMEMQFGKFNVDPSFKMLYISFNLVFLSSLLLGSFPTFKSATKSQHEYQNPKKL